MKIVIDDKAFELKFGFKCLMILGKTLGLNSFNEVVKHLSVLDKAGDDLTFEQAELIEELVVSAIMAHPDYTKNNYDVTDVSILDWLLENPEELTKIVQELVTSMPQEQGKKKPVATGRKTSSRKP